MMTIRNYSERVFYPGIHALRGVAAALVVFQHAVYSAHTVLGEKYVNEFPINFGRLGVVLFFSISGFVIALNRSRPVGRFLIKRVLRIYPSYWIAIVVAAGVMFIGGGPLGIPPITAISLFPSYVSGFSFTIPYWTLVFEVTFYIIAALVFTLGLKDSSLAVLAAVWIISINLYNFAPADSTVFSFPCQRRSKTAPAGRSKSAPAWMSF